VEMWRVTPVVFHLRREAGEQSAQEKELQRWRRRAVFQKAWAARPATPPMPWSLALVATLFHSLGTLPKAFIWFGVAIVGWLARRRDWTGGWERWTTIWTPIFNLRWHLKKKEVWMAEELELLIVRANETTRLLFWPVVGGALALAWTSMRCAEWLIVPFILIIALLLAWPTWLNVLYGVRTWDLALMVQVALALSWPLRWLGPVRRERERLREAWKRGGGSLRSSPSPNCQQSELGYTDRQYGETKTASRPERARGDGQDGERALATGIVPHEWPSGKWNLRARPPSTGTGLFLHKNPVLTMLALYWCNVCKIAFVPDGRSEKCPYCHHISRALTTDIRPVFARERRILEFYGHTGLTGATVWRGIRNQYYYVNGAPVRAPSMTELRRDGPQLHSYLAQIDNYDALDKELLTQYREAIEPNRPHLEELEYEAINFIRQAREQFPRHLCLVSFSGGKDSTVVSDLVRRALHPEVPLHIFSDTTLEDPNTYAYMSRFCQEHPLIEFWETRSPQDFFALVERIGPPSRVIRWCCTIFKTGPINDLMQSFGDQPVLTFYGIRRGESQRRGRYDRTEAQLESGRVLVIDPEGNRAVTLGAKIGQQVTASPILNWSEFDVWLYILLHGLDFNDAYRWGFSRVGCWVCPMNSDWSDFLTRLYYPEKVARWREQLVNFARRIGKPDPEAYVDEKGWVRRFGGAGLENRFRGLESRPCGEAENALRITLTRSIVWDALLEYLKPLGKADSARSRPALGEVYLESRRPREWQALVVQGFEGETTLRVTVIGARDVERVLAYVRFQAIKYQTCLRCSACAAVCPQNAITVKTEPDIYEVDETRCVGCLECVTHFGATGCLVAKSLSVYGSSAK